jgi:hypothetical protein
MVRIAPKPEVRYSAAMSCGGHTYCFTYPASATRKQVVDALDKWVQDPELNFSGTPALAIVKKYDQVQIERRVEKLLAGLFG